MARRNPTLEEAEELSHFSIPAAPDVRLPSRWHLSVDGMPVAPVPDVGTPNFARAVGLYRAQLSPEEQADPQYAPDHPGSPTTTTAASTPTPAPARPSSTTAPRGTTSGTGAPSRTSSPHTAPRRSPASCPPRRATAMCSSAAARRGPPVKPWARG
nr:predicted GPI-anchored protein 58 [Aegilops tauschii subsp. strangulata]